MYIFDGCRISSGGGVVHAVEIIRVALDSTSTLTVFCSQKLFQALVKEFGYKNNFILIKNSYRAILWQIFILPFYLFRYKKYKLITMDGASLCPFRSDLVFHQDLLAFQISKFISKRNLKFYIKYLFVNLANKFTLSRARIVIFQTRHSKNIAIQNVSVNKFYIFPHGISNPKINKFCSDTNDHNFLTVSPIFAYKNIITVLQSLTLLQNFGVKFRYDIVGDITDKREYNKLRKYIENNNLNNIYFHGNVTQFMVYDFLKKSDVFIFPSLCETFGISILEAISLNVPVILSDTKTNREVVYKGGVFFDCYSPTDLFNKLLKLCDTSYKNKVNTSQVKVLARYKWPIIMNNVWNIIEEL